VVAEAYLWQLLRAVAETGAPAWPALVAALDPELAMMARRQPIGRLRDREDTPRDRDPRAGRLHAREFAAIKKLCAIDPPPVLQAWLRVLVRRSAIDYMRESPEFERATASRPNRWISLATLSSGAPAPDLDSIVQKRTLVLSSVRDMVARATAEFRERGDDAFTQLALEWKIGRIHVRRLATKGGVIARRRRRVGWAFPDPGRSHLRREVELTVRPRRVPRAVCGLSGDHRQRDGVAPATTTMHVGIALPGRRTSYAPGGNRSKRNVPAPSMSAV
jgi:hypothetical protein